MTPTTAENKDMGMKATSVIALLAGIWLFISPWVYGAYTSPDAWNSWIVGAVIAILAAIRLASSVPMPGVSWLVCLLGIWTFVSPWIYGYAGTNEGRFINSLCVGVIVFIAGIRNSMSTPHMQHPVTRT